VVDPVPGVTLRMQRGRDELVAPAKATAAEVSFDFTVRVADDARAPNFLGPFAQGPKGGRFVYVNVGTCAGQLDSCWTRRIKVQLGGIDAKLVKSALAKPGSRLEARIAGRGKDGTPACATVPLVSDWELRGAAAR
jgi:hypothetical protein